MMPKIESGARDPATSNHKVYPCDICGREYLNYNQMRSHRLVHIREGKSRGIARDGSEKFRRGLMYFTCEKCNQRWGPCLLPFNKRLCLYCGGNLINPIKAEGGEHELSSMDQGRIQRGLDEEGLR